FHRIAKTAKQTEKAQSDCLDFMDRSMNRMQRTFTDLQTQLEKSEQYNEQTLDRLTKAQQEAFRINEEQKATYQEYIRFMYQSIEKFSDVWDIHNEKLQTYSDEIAKMDPVQSTLEIRQELDALSEQLKAIKKYQSALQKLTDDQEQSELMDQMEEIMQKLNRLEKLAAEPVLFRRRNKR
ncbi:MAG: hypothetical protein LUH07_12885, partial [Lachnospiraceae bacterium]|nr:hypothetical protein [Lachnospiraceae bacterium]